MHSRTGAYLRLFAPVVAAALVLGVGANVASAGSLYGPGAPGTVHATVVGDVVTISWGAPEHVGVSPLETYVVTSQPTGLRCVTRATHCRLRLRQPDLLYRFVVAARNRVAVGPPSRPSNNVRWNVPNSSTTTVPSTTTTTTTTTPTNSAATTSSNTTSTPPSTASSNTQTVHDVAGDALAVHFEGLVDPATSATIYFSPYNGYRYVAVELSVTNLSAAPLTNDPTSSTTITGSDGHTYVGIYDALSDCSNLAYANYTMAPQSNLTGCVVFELPLAIQVTSVQYSLSFGAVDEATWVPSPAS